MAYNNVEELQNTSNVKKSSLVTLFAKVDKIFTI
jgi:hypothetical protein